MCHGILLVTCVKNEKEKVFSIEPYTIGVSNGSFVNGRKYLLLVVGSKNI